MNTYAELEMHLGRSFKTIRLNRNITREKICKQANISINALIHLENGDGATIKTLVRVAKVLGKEDWILNAHPAISINPLTMVHGKTRQRARKKKNRRIL